MKKAILLVAIGVTGLMSASNSIIKLPLKIPSNKMNKIEIKKVNQILTS